MNFNVVGFEPLVALDDVDRLVFERGDCVIVCNILRLLLCSHNSLLSLDKLIVVILDVCDERLFDFLINLGSLLL